METHHPHHHHNRKSWKSYIGEFLMLFLAITLSFFVENQREHYMEHHRAEQFSKSLVKDLQNDIQAMARQQRIANSYIAYSDSLMQVSQSRLEGRNAAVFAVYTRFMYWTGSVNWSRATFEQIKNSGSLRYFTNYQLLEKIMLYDGQINQIQNEFSNHMIRGNMMLNQINEIIPPAFHQAVSKYKLMDLDTLPRSTIEQFFTDRVDPLENKRDQINELLNMVVVQQRNLRYNNLHLQQTTELANELINALKKEYDLN